MVSRKRARDDTEMEEAPIEPSTLQKLRNMWQFASLMQYIYIFGKAVKIDEDFDIEDLETECLKPDHSEKLSEIGLALLKYVSSHKGLTLDIFDEYARRQYVAKAPQRNPFGTDEEPRKFANFDIFTKIRILHQLSTWTLYNPDRLRERMGEKKDTEQTEWRIEPLGWDADDRAYFVLDDDRLYRRTDAPIPPTPKKQKSKPKKGRSTRASKRRRVTIIDTDDGEDDDTTQNEDAKENGAGVVADDDGLGGMKWECIAVTLEEYRAFIDSIRRTRDENTKILHERLVDQVLPVIEKKAEEQERKRLKKERELENLQKMAMAKRSSRIAGKVQKQKEEEEAAEAERKRQAELVMARKEQEKQQKMEEERVSRMMTREQRLKEREMKRVLHEEELRRLQEASEQVENNQARLSERHLKSEMRKRQEELERLQQEESWIFDCSICGVHGENLDDGSHSIACEKCNVWQHSACHGIPKNEAEKDDFHFICEDCKRKEEDAKKPKLPPLKFKLPSSDSPQNDQAHSSTQLDPAVIPAPSPSKSRPPSQHSTSTAPVSNRPHLPAYNPFAGGDGKPVFNHAQPVRSGGYMFPPATQGPRDQQTASALSPSPHRPVSSHSNNASPIKTSSRPLFQPQFDAPATTSYGQHSVASLAPPFPTFPRTAGSPSILGARPGSSNSGGQLFANGVSRAPQEFRPFETQRSSSGYQAQRPVSAQSINHDSFRNSFERQQPFLAPGEHRPATSPQKLASSPHANGQRLPQPNPMITSPSASFPPVGTPASARSPVKQNSPLQQSSPPPLSAFSTPAASFSLARPSPSVASPFSQATPPPSAPVLPNAATGISPEKHDGPRPMSSHSISETAVFPPSTSLSPSAKPQILTPPTKKMTPQKPTPEVNASE